MAENAYRYEHKYLIRIQTAIELCSRLQAVMRLDQHAKNGRYHIRSLYFDDVENTAFFEKINGEDMRSKFRIRYYDYDPSFVQLEKKEKHGMLTRKSAVRIDAETARAFAAGDMSYCYASEEPLLKEFLALTQSRIFRPSVLVDYDRIPFVYPENRTRITIDANVAGASAGMDLFEYRGTMLPVLPDGTAILEVKFDGELPAHLFWVLRDVQKQLQAVSKYCLCKELYQ